MKSGSTADIDKIALLSVRDIQIYFVQQSERLLRRLESDLTSSEQNNFLLRQQVLKLEAANVRSELNAMGSGHHPLEYTA